MGWHRQRNSPFKAIDYIPSQEYVFGEDRERQGEGDGP